MRFDPQLERWRVLHGQLGSDPLSDYGAFDIPGPCGRTLKIIASSGDPSIGVLWEHVSVSLPNRTPNWAEMCFVKDLFWDKEETVMQLHVPASRHINTHPYCLHLWRPKEGDIPLPPEKAV